MVQIVIYAIVLCTCIVVESDNFRYYMGRYMKVYIKNIVMVVLIVTQLLICIIFHIMGCISAC